MKKIVPLLLTTVVLFSGCGSTKNNENEITKDIQAPQEVYIFAGKIQADDSVNLMSKIPARVSDVKVDVGSKINAGDPIIVLDTQDIAAQVSSAEAGISAAQAKLAQVQSGTRPEQIAVTEASLEGAQKAYDLAQTNYDREKQLVESGVDAKVKLEDADRQLAQAKSAYESIQHQLELQKNGPTQQDINAAAAVVKQAQASYESIKANLSNGVITSPISGTVSAKNINVGEMAITGQSLITVVNSGQLHIDGYVPTDLATRLKVGQTVIVKASDVSDKTFNGEISVIDTQVDSRNKQVLVKVALKDGSDLLKPGTFVEIGLKK